MTVKKTKTIAAAPSIPMGWREWVRLPEFEGAAVKAKVDTGLHASFLHAEGITEELQGNKLFLNFDLHPNQRNARDAVSCRIEVLDKRPIGSVEKGQDARYVVRTPVFIGEHALVLDLTLTRRDIGGYRMILGRGAIADLFVVDPSRSFLQGRRRD